jgi:hypothetical protein
MCSTSSWASLSLNAVHSLHDRLKLRKSNQWNLHALSCCDIQSKESKEFEHDASVDARFPSEFALRCCNYVSIPARSLI